jgi:ferredoxin
MYKIIHERKKCISCGACATICPELFEMSEKDNLAMLKNSKEKSDGIFELETEEIQCAKETADVCPVKIIKIEK